MGPGLCSKVFFSDLGNPPVTAVTTTVIHDYPTANKDGLPLRYDIAINGDAAGYQAQLALCYADADVVAAGIPLAAEGDLHIYAYAGAETWTQHSTVDAANNIITSTLVTDFGERVWGIGIPEDQPTAVIVTTVHGAGLRSLFWFSLLLGIVIMQRRFRRRRQ